MIGEEGSPVASGSRWADLPTPAQARGWEEVSPGTFERIMASVRQHRSGRQLRVHLMQAQDAGLHGIQHVVADIGRLHGASQVPQLDAQRLGQDGTCGDTKHPEERTTLHVGIRRVVAPARQA